jgi:hypothetical protein
VKSHNRTCSDNAEVLSSTPSSPTTNALVAQLRCTEDLLMAIVVEHQSQQLLRLKEVRADGSEHSNETRQRW